jgi:translation initiation factor eIF-2B subunit delta
MQSSGCRRGLSVERDPGQKNMTNWARLIEPIQADVTSGAAELATRAVDAIHRWLEESGALPPAAWRRELSAFGRALIASQPSMAPLLNLVNEVLIALNSATTLPESQQQVWRTAAAFRQEIERSSSRLVTAALPLFMANSRVLTLSYSSTVLEVLRAAHADGLLATVYCTESRPACEGQRLARQLAEVGLEVRFGVDAALAVFAPQASLALVGADSITAEGVVNKVGTAALARAAHDVHIPCMVIGGRQKCFPMTAALPDFQPARPPDEVWPDPPPGVVIWNAYFECTPLAHFTGIVMETGRLTPEAIRQELANMPVAKELQKTSPSPRV